MPDHDVGGTYYYIYVEFYLFPGQVLVQTGKKNVSLTWRRSGLVDRLVSEDGVDTEVITITEVEVVVLIMVTDEVATEVTEDQVRVYVVIESVTDNLIFLGGCSDL